MKHQQKIEWMEQWAKENNCELVLDGTCGFGRSCVGVIIDDLYPDYEWYDDNFERVDDNGEVWIPYAAYHKHPCVAVLGTGEEAEEQLYDWLKWFNDNNFKLEVKNTGKDPFSIAGVLFNRHVSARMVKQT